MPHLVGIDLAALCKYLDSVSIIAADIQANGLALHRRDLAELLSCRDGPTILHLAYTAAVRDGLCLAGDLRRMLVHAGRLLSGRGGDPVAIRAAAERLLAALYPRGRGARAHRRPAEAGPPQKTKAEIAAELERRRHTRFPGVRVLAREYGINAGDMSRIISRSAALRGWKARHATPQVPRVEGRDVADLPSRDAQIADLVIEQARDDGGYANPRP